MQKAHQWEIAGEAAWGVALYRESVIRRLAEHPDSVQKASPSGKSTGLEPQYSLQTPATVPATASDLFPTSLEARSQAG
jgi:hypothetical protein